MRKILKRLVKIFGIAIGAIVAILLLLSIKEIHAKKKITASGLKLNEQMQNIALEHFSSVKEEHPLIETKEGKIRGFNRNGNAVFYGIPYGNPCDGEARFLPASRKDAWEDILECTEFGPSAMQDRTPSDGKNLWIIERTVGQLDKVLSGGVELNRSQIPVDENCLNLNVVTPSLDTTEKRAVIVYIHGGGYASMDGALVAEQCDRLCDEENVVVVSVNHRLGVFGALYLGHLDEKYQSSGLVGMMDLQLALEWVQDNIASFGGNPEHVVVIGESGGGMKISHLMAMPESKGLFQGAWISSGACRPAITSVEDGISETRQLLEALGLNEDNWRELLELDSKVILEAASKVTYNNTESGAWAPIPDGIHLKYNENGDYKPISNYMDIPIVTGSSEDELAITPVAVKPFLTWSGLKKELLYKLQTKDEMMPYLTEENYEQVIDVFRNHYDNTKPARQIYAQIISMTNFLGGGSEKLALQKADNGESLVYLYTIAFDTPLYGSYQLACAWHTADLPLFFRSVYLEDMEMRSYYLGHALATFAKTGSPSSDVLEWKPFTILNRETLYFDDTVELMNNPLGDIYEALEEITGDTEFQTVQ